jgi:D-sedoheptulose 7-phosphate isomerase
MTETPTFDLVTEMCKSLCQVDDEAIDRMAHAIRHCARLFVIGSGGGAAHASHATCDFRKLCGVEAYCPSDNVAELTARVNDDGWDAAYSNWLAASGLGARDAVLVVSVGGGDQERNISPNLCRAVDLARERGATVLAVVGRDGGHAGRHAAHMVLIPCDRPEWVTPVVESVQSAVLHALAVHPVLQIQKAKWESAA